MPESQPATTLGPAPSARFTGTVTVVLPLRETVTTRLPAVPWSSRTNRCAVPGAPARSVTFTEPCPRVAATTRPLRDA